MGRVKDVEVYTADTGDYGAIVTGNVAEATARMHARAAIASHTGRQPFEVGRLSRDFAYGSMSTVAFREVR